MNTGCHDLLAQIGAGPDGVSFRAREHGKEEIVEVRILAAARLDAVRWELLTRRFQLAQLIEHPGARNIIEINLDADPPWLVLSGLPGVPLSKHLDSRLPLPPVEAVSLTIEVAEVLAAAHRFGLGHGRIGPRSVYFSSNGVQIDFTGLATSEDDLPSPGATAEAMWSDVSDLAGLMIWLSSGQAANLDDTLPAVIPGPVRVLAGEVLRCPEEERPTMVELVNRLRHMVVVLQTQAGLDVTNADSLPSPAPLTPARTTRTVRESLGRFRLLEKLGQGGMGEVYRAEDTSNGAVVAIKTLLPEWSRDINAVRRFRKEARLLKEVNNPHVANYIELNQDDGLYYIALEYVSGQSLSKRLEAGKPVEERFALAIIADVCRALVEAHNRGIIHRDIKPDNILLPANADMSAMLEGTEIRPVAKLSDFGLARHVVESQSLQMTRTGTVVGTPLYLSPEQCTGATLDPRSDVYGLGATLFHLLTGRPPFMGDTPLVLINHHCNTPAPLLKSINSALSDGVCGIVAKALNKAPAHRHANAGEMLRDIERVLRGEPATALAHPLLPDADPSRVLEYAYEWELTSSPTELWPHVSNTERLNRAIHLPAVDFSTKVDETGRVRRKGRIKKLGVEAVWEEHPFEWVEARRFGVLRQCQSGPFRWLMSMVDLKPRAGGGTILRHSIRVEPSGMMGRTFAAMELGVRTRRSLERVYKRIDAAVSGKLGSPVLVDPFEEASQLSKTQQRRLDEMLDGLSARGVDPTVSERLGAYLATAPAQEVARLRPIALARRLGLNPDAVLAACLHGAHEGLLVLMWDLLCPLCRIPSEIKDTLKALREHGRCEACNADYELDFGRSVELIFRVHPSIRDAELGVFCIGGPSHSPHVVAQVRVAPGERVDVDLDLTEGAYLLRGPQLPTALEARVEPSARAARWEVSLGKLAEQSKSRMRLRPGGQVLEVYNPHDRELVVRLERTAARDDAVTAARAASLALFRELFPGEVLSPGRLVSVASVTLLLTDMPEARELAQKAGEAKAFALLHEHLLRMESLSRINGGALVKAVGDGGLAAFHEPAAALQTSLDLENEASEGLRLTLHRGPAMAATINEHLDYFGTVVRQIAAMLERTRPGERLMSQSVMDDPPVSALLHQRGQEGEVVPGEPVMHRFRTARKSEDS